MKQRKRKKNKDTQNANDSLKEKRVKEVALIGPMPLEEKSMRPSYGNSFSLLLFIDGGARHRARLPHSTGEDLLALGEDHISIGDGDGLKAPQEMDILLPEEKDESDLQAALNYLLSFIEKNSLLKNQRKLKLHAHGLWGGRLDHQLFNLGAFFRLCQRIPQTEVLFYDEKGTVVGLMALKNLSFSHRGSFSLLPCPWEEQILTIKGQVKYKLKEAKLLPLSSQTLSNEGQGALEIISSDAILALLNKE